MRSCKLFTPIARRSGFIYRNRSADSVRHDTEAQELHTSVDVNEIDHHSKLSNKWWDQKENVYGLHAMNALRVPFVRDGLANVDYREHNPCCPLQGIKILDVGCGGGILAEPLARIGATVTGIDPSSELIAIAQSHAALDPDLSERLTYECTTIEEHAEGKQGFYNAVVASEVLEHVTDKALFLKFCVKSLKPGGSIFITTINKTTPSWFAGVILAENVLNIVPPGTHEWEKFISPDEVQRLLQTCGCQTNLIHGIAYNMLTNRWSWIASTAINYALQAVKREDVLPAATI